MAIRESYNKTNITGILLENGLEKLNNDKLKNFIAGELIIRVGSSIDDINASDVSVKFFAKELKNDGKPNKIYKSLLTLMTMPSVASDGKGVEINISGGNIAVNDFYTDDLELISYPELKGTFYKKSPKNYEPSSTFEFEGIVRKVYEEVKKIDGQELETGRLCVEIVGVNYLETALPVKFIVEKEKAIKYIKAYYAAGRTVKVNGNIIVKTEKFSRVEESAFGDDIIKEYESVKTELIISSGTQPYDENAYTAEDAQQIMQNRNVHLENEKAKKIEKMNGGNSVKTDAPKQDNSKGKGFPF